MNADNIPMKVKANGRASNVAAVEDWWKVEDEWWRDAPISRLYYDVVLENGHRATVFHDVATGHWFRQNS